MDPADRAGGQALFTGWGGELATCRKFAPTARNCTASNLMSQVGLGVSEACKLDLADIKWDLGRFGKLHVRHGEGARGSGPRERMVPLINGADRMLRWFIEDVRGQFDDDRTRPGAPLFPSERKGTDGSSRLVGDDALRNGLAAAAEVASKRWCKGDERRFRTERPSSYERTHARAVTSIAHPGDPCRDRCRLRPGPTAGRVSGGCCPSRRQVIIQFALEVEVEEFLGPAHYQRAGAAADGEAGETEGVVPVVRAGTATGIARRPSRRRPDR
ncbi:hypothetical protein OIU91_02520 [Streptomyces sp. NBC_01456]|uniref:hypothetical protein n=1 Tax=Streptomyces sp. NBC_01456 TaxID=2975868 RepID=UPI002E2F69E2|nr:hypothetical protein [Streptomyces sp. NBC_01456]